MREDLANNPTWTTIVGLMGVTYNLRLTALVILLRSAPQPSAGDLAVAQPTTTPFHGLVRAREQIGDAPPRLIPRDT
jgi:hypothetical protein